MAILNISESNFVFNYLWGKSFQVLCLKNIGLDLFIFDILCPSNKQIFISISNPSFDSIDFVSFVGLGNVRVDVGSIRAYLIFS